jgi:hypothetical protein
MWDCIDVEVYRCSKGANLSKLHKPMHAKVSQILLFHNFGDSDFRFQTYPSATLTNISGNLWLGILDSGSLALDLWLEAKDLGSLPLDFWLGSFGLRSQAWDIWLCICASMTLEL